MDEALTACAAQTSTFAVTGNLEGQVGASFRATDPVKFDTSLIVVTANETRAVVGAMDDIVANSYRIGMWAWEVEDFPAGDAAQYLDEVWTGSDFVRDAIAARVAIPVHTVPPPLPQRSHTQPPTVPARLGVPADRPWFFFAFDYLSVAERKNPWGLIEAFTRAFSPDEGPVLVIKTMNAAKRIPDAERLRLLVHTRPDIVLIEEYLEADDLTALMANCTAYVSLHRAEGLGLTIAEAMAWGRPVVVSEYSGNMQFTNAANAFLVPCSPTPIPPGLDPYPAVTPWGEPDLDVAATHLRTIITNPARAAAIGRQAAIDIATLHTPQAAAARVRNALDAARQALNAQRATHAREARDQRRFTNRVRRWVARRVN
jgi:glycosyltransferase involved in cell wall biosynthesis